MSLPSLTERKSFLRIKAGTSEIHYVILFPLNINAFAQRKGVQIADTALLVKSSAHHLLLFSVCFSLIRQNWRKQHVFGESLLWQALHTMTKAWAVTYEDTSSNDLVLCASDTSLLLHSALRINACINVPDHYVQCSAPKLRQVQRLSDPVRHHQQTVALFTEEGTTLSFRNHNLSFTVQVVSLIKLSVNLKLV